MPEKSELQPRIEEVFPTLFLGRSFLARRLTGANGHGSGGEILGKDNRPVRSEREFTTIQVSALYFSAALNPEPQAAFPEPQVGFNRGTLWIERRLYHHSRAL